MSLLFRLSVLGLCAVAAGTSCNTDGSSATYSETLTTALKSGVTKRAITTTGCPNHYNMCTGKTQTTGCGGVGSAGTVTDSTIQTTSYTVLAYPVIATATTDATCSMGSLAIAFNGVSIFGPAVSTTPTGCNLLNVDDDEGNTSAEWETFDHCSGHAQTSGIYHYHFPPTCLLSALNAQVSTSSPSAIQGGHSPQIGWHLDGFPIYGPKGMNGVQMQTCSKSGTNAPYCTDSCGGLEYEIPTLDNFKYRYYMMGNTSDMSSVPSYPKPSTDYYPYAPSCRKGCLMAEYNAGTCTGTSGYTSSYTAAVNSGYTTPITSSMIEEYKKSEQDAKRAKQAGVSKKMIVVAASSLCVVVALVAAIVIVRRRRQVVAVTEDIEEAVEALL